MQDQTLLFHPGTIMTSTPRRRLSRYFGASCLAVALSISVTPAFFEAAAVPASAVSTAPVQQDPGGGDGGSGDSGSHQQQQSSQSEGGDGGGSHEPQSEGGDGDSDRNEPGTDWSSDGSDDSIRNSQEGSNRQESGNLHNAGEFDPESCEFDVQQSSEEHTPCEQTVEQSAAASG
jgi:hypothetical protein